jgi:hypothetical protein
MKGPDAVSRHGAMKAGAGGRRRWRIAAGVVLTRFQADRDKEVPGAHMLHRSMAASGIGGAVHG